MKKCKSCLEPFEPKQKFNSTIKSNRCEVCLKTAQALKNLSAIKKDKKIKQKEDLLTLQDYLKLTQQVFNSWIRKRDAGKPCFSCGKKINGVVHASHYYNANNHYNVRFDENNVFSCCYSCNVAKSGNLIEYGINLEKKIGKEEFIILREKAYQTRKYTKIELKELLLKYKQKLKE
jgi:hypothetical protein